MTVAELDRWAVQRTWGAERQERMAAFLGQFTVILVDRKLCRTWAGVTNHARYAEPRCWARLEEERSCVPSISHEARLRYQLQSALRFLYRHFGRSPVIL